MQGTLNQYLLRVVFFLLVVLLFCGDLLEIILIPEMIFFIWEVNQIITIMAITLKRALIR